jgi:hypothetical protein
VIPITTDLTGENQAKVVRDQPRLVVIGFKNTPRPYPPIPAEIKVPKKATRTISHP